MKVGQNISVQPADWRFNEQVADQFDEHIALSIPFYHEGHELICHLSDFFVHRDSRVYDLGTATGQLLKRLAQHHAHKPEVTWYGIDNEPGMIARARQQCQGLANVEFIEEDLIHHQFAPADLIIAYYTLQFVPERFRQQVFDKLYQSLNWGGALILFEKVRAPDARFQDITTTLYRDYKRHRGFTVEEIYNKESALKGVLSPFSTAGNLGLLQRAGFEDIMTVMKYICFEGFLCIK